MKTENQYTEYKRELTSELDLEKEVIAFLNTKGGSVYIGIDDNGEAVGVKDMDKSILAIKDRIKNNIAPSVIGLFDVVEETISGKSVIRIIVASGSEKPYFKKKFGMTEKGCFIRVGTSVEIMPQTTIEKLFSSRTRNSIRKIKAPRADLTFEQLRIYYEEKGMPLNKSFKKNLELLTENGELNYVAYLLADENNISIKVARYNGLDRVELIENAELGYCSIVKATKNVLEKIEIENRVFIQITSKERIEKRLWNPIALREAVINAFVHNDYTRELAPKFELFDDRIEITSVGTLPEGISQDEFFEGVSVPRNKELMRIYKDLELVEQLGSGIPRILQVYGKEIFKLSENFTRLVFPAAKRRSEVTDQVTDQVKKLISVIENENSRSELMVKLNLAHSPTFRENYLQPALQANLIELTIPEKPNSSKQKYRLTEKGKSLQKQLQNTERRSV